MENSLLNKKPWKKWVIAIMFLTVCTVVGWFFFQVEDVTVAGSEIYTDDEIRDMFLDDPFSSNSIYLYVKNRFFGFHTVPFIEEIQLEWTSFNDLVVQVYEKSLVACFSYMGEYIYFDKDGIVLETSRERMENVPVINGIPYTQFVMNEKMEIGKENLLKRILDISQLIKHYKLSVDEVEFTNKDEVTFFCGGIRVELGNKELYDQQIVALSSVLEKANEKKLSGRIDMRNYIEGGNIHLEKDEDI
jgi:cell division protein FtsQ